MSFQIPVPSGITDQLIAFRGHFNCYVFTKINYEPSIWMRLKRLDISNSYSLRGSTLKFLNCSFSLDDYRAIIELAGIVTSRRNTKLSDNEVKRIILNERLHNCLSLHTLPLIDAQRLMDINDSYYSTSRHQGVAYNQYHHQLRIKLSNTLGRELLERWEYLELNSGERADNRHIENALNRYNQARSIKRPRWDLLPTLRSLGELLLTFTTSRAKAELRLSTNYHKYLEKLTTKEAQSIETLFREPLTNLRALLKNVDIGLKKFNLLLQDHSIRRVLVDYLNGLKESKYFSTHNPERINTPITLGLEVAIALSHNNKNTITQFSKAREPVTKGIRIGPFTAEIIDLLLDVNYLGRSATITMAG